MWTDPIVEEVRAHRRAIAAEAGNDIHELFRRARAREALLGGRVRSPLEERPSDTPPAKAAIPTSGDR